MAQVHVQIRLRQRWWVRPLLRCIICICNLFPPSVGIRVFAARDGLGGFIWRMIGRHGFVAEVH